MSDPVIDLITSRFDSMERNMKDGLKDIKSSMNEGFGLHDERIKSLEDTRTQQHGIMIGGGAVVTAVASFFGWVMHKFGG